MRRSYLVNVIRRDPEKAQSHRRAIFRGVSTWDEISGARQMACRQLSSRRLIAMPQWDKARVTARAAHGFGRGSDFPV